MTASRSAVQAFDRGSKSFWLVSGRAVHPKPKPLQERYVKRELFVSDRSRKTLLRSKVLRGPVSGRLVVLTFDAV